MIARLLAALGLLVPMQAQASSGPDWAGVYEGTVGRYPVTLCLQSWGDGSGMGAYYYHSQLKLIRLDGTGDPARWAEAREGTTGEKRSGPRWTLAGLGTGRLTGTWQNGKRRLPLRLARAAGAQEAEGLPCGSRAFNARRAVPLPFEDTPQTLGSFAYTRHTLVPPAHLAEVSIELISFAPQQPGDGAVVEALRADRPRGTPDEALFECLAGAAGSLGVEGYWEQGVRPVYVGEAFLAVEQTLGSFCGGAHPNYQTVQRVFDRSSGAELDLTRWLSASAFAEERYGLRPISAPLRELALRHWPESAGGECREAVSDQEYWTLGLSEGGLLLTPDLPHALTACEASITVPWSDLDPYLSDEGRAGRARMR